MSINRESDRAIDHALKHLDNAKKAAADGDTAIAKMEIGFAEGLISAEKERSENSRRINDKTT